MSDIDDNNARRASRGAATTKMRVFIAFDISDEAKQFLLDSQKQLKSCKATLVKEFHLTLKFIGEVSEGDVEQILSKLSKIRFDSFDASLSKVGVFPKRDYARVVWIGLEPKDTISALQKQVDDATEKFGIKQKDHFEPHITLVRIKDIDDKKAFLDSIDKIQVPNIKFPVSSFKLIKSTLTPQGPVYEVLRSFDANQ
jgi:2'-5' RNA ligase